MPTYPPKIPASPSVGNPTDRIIVYGLSAHTDLASSQSPATHKLETYLRFMGLDYEAETKLPFGAPKGKVPYIQHGNNTIGDSEIIIKYLHNTYGSQSNIKAPTDPQQRAVVTAVRRICELHLVQAVAWYNLMTADGLPHFKKNFLHFAPAPLRGTLAGRFRKILAGRLKILGLGDHCEQDFVPMIEDSLDALVEFLGDKLFITGDIPTEGDAIMFAMLDIPLNQRMETTLVKLIKARPTLVEFVKRIRHDYYDQPTKFKRV